MSDIVERLRDQNSVVVKGLFHAIPAMRDAAGEIERLRGQVNDIQRTAWLILRSCTFDGGYVAVERSTVAEFDPGKAVIESWTDAKDGTYCFRALSSTEGQRG